MPPTRILLARHGETDWNRLGRWQGQADPPLNDDGRRQAAALAEKLAGDGIAAIYSSDLRRASETAEAIGARLGLEVVLDRGLREIDVGSWSGLTRDEVEAQFPEGFARWRGGEIGHDGETSEELTERVVETVERIAAAHEGQTVVVVTHGGSIRALAPPRSRRPGRGALELRHGLDGPRRGRALGSSGLTSGAGQRVGLRFLSRPRTWRLNDPPGSGSSFRTSSRHAAGTIHARGNRTSTARTASHTTLFQSKRQSVSRRRPPTTVPSRLGAVRAIASVSVMVIGAT